jgi:glycine C-acetyltransferase
MAAIGAFIASDDPEIIMFLKYNMRSQTYAKALPMPYVEGCRKRLEMIKTMPELRSKLWENVKAMQDGLRGRGFNIGETESPVTPVFLHSEGGVPEVTRMVRIFAKTWVFSVRLWFIRSCQRDRSCCGLFQLPRIHWKMWNIH